jgi:hypothetical protein
MPLTDEQLNLYEQNLKQRADDAARSKLGNIGPGYANYGSPSMTNTVNQYNYDRMNDYMNALAQRENLAQTWQQIANQRALTAGQVGNMEKDHERGLAGLGLQKQQQQQQHEIQQKQLAHAEKQHGEDLAQSWKIAKQKHDLEKEQMEKGYSLQKEQLEHQKKQSAISNVMQKAMQIYNMHLGKRQMSQTEWVNKTNALLQNMGLQISQDRLNYAREHPENIPFDADGNPTGDKARMLNWMANILTSTEQATGENQDRAFRAANARSSADMDRIRLEGQLRQLEATNPSLWGNLVSTIGMPFFLKG